MTDYTQLLNVARAIEYDSDATAGLVSELADALERLTTPPAADEREALAVDDVAQALCRIEMRSSGRPFDEVVAPGVELWMRYRFEAERLIEELRPLLAAGFRRQGPITHEWEYRAVALEPDTRDVYDSTGLHATPGEAIDRAAALGLLESNIDLPQLVLGVERRRKAGPWEPFEAARDA